jgi:PKD repeat protein
MKNLLKNAFCLLLILASFLQVHSQVDTEFWFVVPELSYRNHYAGKPGRLFISTLEIDAIVTVNMPAIPGFQEIVLNIDANSAASLDLSHLIDDTNNPANNQLENKNLTLHGINNFGLHITATNLINVYWSVDYSPPGTGAGGADIWTLKGANALGTLFYTPFQTTYPNRNSDPKPYSAIDVVATRDNTQVTFTLPPGIQASYGLPLSNVPAGGTINISLNEGQTFSLFPINKSELAGNRLAGTRIESNFPIAVTLKDDMVAVGPSNGGSDVIGDQLIPVHITGNDYIVPDIANPNHVYVLSTEPDTYIYVYDPNGGIIKANPDPYPGFDYYARLENAGEQALVIIPNGAKFARITSAKNPGDHYKPFYVFQMGLENNSRGGALVPPIGCTGNTQLAFTRAFEDNKFYFFIIVEEGNQDKFLIDGAKRDNIINPGSFVPVAGTGYLAFYSNSINSNTLPVGQHLVTNTGGIFHLGILNGFPGLGQGQKINYGYYSDFGNLNVGASVAGTNSQVIRACFADPVQLVAFGGTAYNWTPDTYLDDASSNMPIATNLPAGSHLYTVDVSGACGSGTIEITILVAPPVRAFFQTDVASGCSPLEVNFTDMSEGTWSWRYDTGEGSPPIIYDIDPETVNIDSPPDPFTFSRTFFNTTNLPVEYTVELLVKNESGCADFFTKTIVVFPEIEADFVIDTDKDDGCDPLEVSFQNSSWGNTDKWYWEFGDGGTSIEENPVHVYRNIFGPGSTEFTAKLVATSPYLCRDSSFQTITVNPYIEALFTIETISACTPFEIEIFNQSFGADTYYWDFGDGTTSDSPDPLIRKTYVNAGNEPETYTISLRAENGEGCFDIMEREITILPEVVATFVPDPEDGCSPLTVEFINNSTGAVTWQWEFGDGGSSTSVAPVHIYDRNMTGDDIDYTVVLVATSENMCRDTAFHDITVHPYIEAAFTVETVTGCHPFGITVNNISYGADRYFWDFGDNTPGSESNSAEPVLTYTYFNTTGETQTYFLTLRVENDQGCTDVLIREITVHPELTANFMPDSWEGCHPLTVSFDDLSLNAVTWYWEFGDGASSVERSPQHTFTNYGTSDTIYEATLTTTSGDGLCVKSVSWPIRVQGIAEAAFSVSESIDCTPFEVHFENLSTGAMSYTWNMGDGTIFTTDDPGPQSHTYFNTGFTDNIDFEVTLSVVNYAGCNNETSKTITVYPGIDVAFSASEDDGCHPFTVDFTTRTIGGDRYFWDFGDGSSTSSDEPSHTFMNTGTTDRVYTVKLVSVASNNICRDSFFMDITVRPYIKADFSLPVALDCNPFDVTLENNSVNASVFHWDFGDGESLTVISKDPFVHRFSNDNFNNQQQYEISLVAEHVGCFDTIRKTITVQPDIVARFSASQVQGCHPLTVDFSNLSMGAEYYSWDFDNGTSAASEGPSMTFSNMGDNDKIYRVKLIATAGNHVCSDSFFLDIVVHPYIKADFTFLESIDCSPLSVNFLNSSIGGEVFYWDFDDGSEAVTTGTDPVSHPFINTGYSDPATFLVTMIAENQAGCRDTILRAVNVHPAIEAAFSPDIDEGCHPLTVTFGNESQGGATWLWEFGDGSSSNSVTPVYTFTNFTDASVTRQVRLTVRSVYGCTDVTVRDITIHPKPAARYEIDHVISCPPFDLEITNTSINASNFTWNFGDGETLVTNSIAPFSYIYNNLTGEIIEYDLKLIAETSHGCLDSTWQKVSVYPGITAGFNAITQGCSPLTIAFENLSAGGFIYQWVLGDGITMGTTDPVHVYTNYSVDNVVYDVTLTATSRFGCIDSISRPITVYPQPRVDFTATPYVQVYPSSTFGLVNETSPGPWEYLWDMGDGSLTTEKDPVYHVYEYWGEYDIILSASSAGCVDRAVRKVVVVPPPPGAQFDPVVPACAPLSVRFTNNSVHSNEWFWEFDDGNTSEEFEPVHTFSDHGIYNVRLTAKGDGGTSYYYSIVEVYRSPVVMFKVEPRPGDAARPGD